ncbi:MAG: TonB-dependent receptor [Deltaproteobacteria bacterium]|nr:TonB-dependent receptor [Deltaproteobacteria bacterium]
MPNVALVLVVMLLGDAPASSPAAQAPNDATDDALAGADDLFSIFEEQERVGIASMSGRVVALREAPGSNWVLDQATLGAVPGLDLYDVLRTLPGMVPRELSLSQNEANMRLLNSVPDMHSLVVLDGRSLTADASGAFFDRKMLTLRDIERVELVNGPASTLYGPNAMFGVISVQRKKPRRQGTKLTFAVDGGFATGSPASSTGPLALAPLASAYVSYDQGWGKGGLRLSVTGMYLPSFGYQNDSGLILQEPGRKVAGTLDIRQSAGAWELRAQLDVAAKRSIYELGDGGRTDQEDYSVNLLAERERLAGADDRLLINASVRHFRVVLRQAFAGIALTSYAMRITAPELRAVYALPSFRNNELTVGAQLRFSVVDATFALQGPPHQMLFGVFAEDTFRPVKPLILTAGVRVDLTHRINDSTGVTASPRASIAWLINDRHSLRVDYATAFRSAQMVERLAAFLSADGYPVIVGNPALKNEVIHNFSLAWLGQIGWATARLEAFVAHTVNNIAPIFERYDSDVFTTDEGRALYRAPGGGRYKYPFYFKNLAYFWIPGAVARIELKPHDALRLFANYTFVPADVMHYAGAGAELRVGRFVGSAQLYFHDQPEQDLSLAIVNIPGRVFMNARAAYTIDAAGRFTIALSAMNLFDVRFFRSLIPGRPIYSGDATTGERNGPRLWLTLELKPFGP